MFDSDNASQNFVTSQGLYCVWIRATETPGAPLIAVWMDTKMRAFNAVDDGSACLTMYGEATEEATAFDS